MILKYKTAKISEPENEKFEIETELELGDEVVIDIREKSITSHLVHFGN